MKYAGYSFALPPTAHNQMLFLRLSMTAFIALDEDEKQRVVIRAGCSALSSRHGRRSGISAAHSGLWMKNTVH